MPAALGLSTYRWNNTLKSFALLGAFPVVLLGLTGAFFLILGLVQADARGLISVNVFNGLGLPFPRQTLPTPGTLVEEGLRIYGPFILGVAAFWIFIGYFFHDALIAFSAGAKPLARRDSPTLYNLLENLCIARGLQMPKLFVIDTPARNAFASGLSEKTFSITLTRGLIEALSNDELEAVLAHELSHIVNRDVSLLVVAVLFGGMLSFLAELMWRGLRRTRFSSGNRRSGGGVVLIFLLAAVLLSVGYFISLLLRFALSRRREYLADAGAVELTKRPENLISALEKIAPHAAMTDVPSGVQAMMIENPPTFFDLFDTHPPIEARIAVLRRLGNLPEPGMSILPKTSPY